MLIITIAVTIIIASAIMIPANNYFRKAEIGRLSDEVSQVQDAVNSYYVLNNGSLPIKNDVLTKDTVVGKVDANHRAEFEQELSLNGDTSAEFYNIDENLIELDEATEVREYIISYPNLNVYDLKGAKLNNSTYFSLSSRMDGVVKVKDTTRESNSSTTATSGATLKVTSNSSEATNKLGIHVECTKKTADKLYLTFSNIGQKEVAQGKLTFDFDNLNEVNSKSILTSSLTSTEINAFNNGTTKTIDVIVTRNDEVIAKESLDVSNYDAKIPSLSISKKTLYEDMKVVRLNVSDVGSGLKEVRYDYLKRTDEFGKTTNYYDGVSSFNTEYMKTKAKVLDASNLRNGQADLKLPIDVSSVYVMAIDKAGNTTSVYSVSYTSGITCTITPSPNGSLTSPVTSENITYTFVFSTSVVDFTASDIEVENGEIVSFSGSGTTYTLVVKSVSEEEVVQRVAIKEGVCTNSAKSSRNYAASMQLKVKSKEKVEATGVTLNKSSMRLRVDQNETLTATVTPSDVPSDTLTWTSSNSSVATVSQAGVVIAKSEGTAVITVRAPNNMQAQCTVTVKNGVAKIGSTYYDTLQEAFNASSTSSSSPSQIELLDNITVTSAQTFASGRYATLNMGGYSITSSTSSVYVLNNAGTLTLTGSGTISSSAYRTVYNNGTLTLNGPTISTTYSSYCIYTLTGTLNIYAGTVTSTSSYAIYKSSGILRVGNSSNTLSTTSPTVQSASNYGIYNNSTGTMYFYSGRISGRTYAISGTTPTLRSGCEIVYNFSGTTETITLATTGSAVASIGSKKYATLQSAFNASSSSTINLLKSTSESATLASGKTAYLYLQGYTLSCATSSAYTITNNGTLTINGSGTITSSAYRAINNTGTMTITNTPTITNTASGQPAVNNNGKIVLNSGTISSQPSSANSSNHGLFNGTTSSILEINGGTIKGHDGVRNLGTITMKGGEIHSNNDDAIEFYSGTITMTGGSITGVYGIYTGGSGPRTLVLGTDDGTVSTTSPVINVSSTALSNGSITTSFFDGTITGSNAISDYSKVTTPSGYEVIVNNSGGKDTATLVTSGTAVAKIGTKKYSSLQKAFDVSSNSTIYLLKSVAESATLASGKTASLYLQGYTLSCATSSTYTITNNGTLTINGSGTVTSSAYRAINNVGTLTIGNSANITNTSVGNPAVNNTGKIILNSGTISSQPSSPNSSNHGLFNGATSSILEMNGGTIKGYDGVRNLGTMTIKGGEIHSNNDDAIEFYSGTITMTGGSITGKYGIYTGGSGPRTLVLGVDDGVVSTTSPVINVTNTAVSNSSITTSFFDGSVKGSTTFSTQSTVTVPTGYKISVTNSTATLIAGPHSGRFQ